MEIDTLIQIAGDITFPGWSGIIETLQNSLRLQASSSGTIIVGSQNDLLPEVDSAQDLGQTSQRWQQLNAMYNAAPTGVGVETLIGGSPQLPIGTPPFPSVVVSGHVLPAITATFDLGINTGLWGAVNANSGVFSNYLQAPTCKFLTIDAVTGLDNVKIRSHLRPDFVFNNHIALGSTAKRWSNVFATSGNFTSRVAIDGSGVALRNELVNTIMCQINGGGGGLTTRILQIDNLNTRPYLVPFKEKVRLSKACALMTRHQEASQPSDWFIDIRKSTDGVAFTTVASGIFSWPPNSSVVQNYTVEWSPSLVEFEPNEGIAIEIHNNGSGTALTGPVVRAFITVERNVDDNGLGA